MCFICYQKKYNPNEEIDLKDFKEPITNRYLPRCPVHPKRGALIIERIN